MQLIRYYKATTPDGTDFYSGTVDYAAALRDGTTIRHEHDNPVPGSPETYLSVSTEPADCTGFCWPCRLFEVEPIDPQPAGPDLPNKRTCQHLRVLAELPAWQALGPNGQAVAAFIEKAHHLTQLQLRRLPAAWNAAWNAAWRAARGAAWHAARGAAWHAAQDAAQDAAWDAAWDAAQDAARGAVIALLARDLISEEHFDILYGPWQKAIEQPESATC